MELVLGGVIAALAAGALAKAGGTLVDKATGDAYGGLKALLVKKLGVSGAVQGVEDAPDSKAAQAALAEALAKAKLATDVELAAKAKELEERIAAAGGDGIGREHIRFGDVRGKVDAVVQDLVARGGITFGDVVAETGDARVSGLRAGAGGGAPPKNP